MTADAGASWPEVPPAAVLFDCDGTLADTEPGLWRAKAEVLAEHGLAVDDDLRVRTFGMGVPGMADLIETRTGRPVDRAALSRQVVEACVHHAASTATALPGARALIEAVARHVPTAVVSNSPRVLLDATLAATGLDDVVVSSVAGDEVAAPKPAPDGYLLACRRWGVAPREVVVVEDSDIGVAAGRAAGAEVVRFGGTSSAASPDVWAALSRWSGRRASDPAGTGRASSLPVRTRVSRWATIGA